MRKQAIIMSMAVLFLCSGSVTAMHKSKFKDMMDDFSLQKKKEKDIIKTRHATQRAAERSISDEDIKWVMNHGNQYNTEEEYKKLRYCLEKGVAVIFNEKTKTVITTYCMSKNKFDKLLAKMEKIKKRAEERDQLDINAKSFLKDIQPNDGGSMNAMQKTKPKSNSKRSDQTKIAIQKLKQKSDEVENFWQGYDGELEGIGFFAGLWTSSSSEDIQQPSNDESINFIMKKPKKKRMKKSKKKRNYKKSEQDRLEDVREKDMATLSRYSDQITAMRKSKPDRFKNDNRNQF